MSNEPVDWQARPENLMGVEGAYSLIVYSNVMEPELEVGSTVDINPRLPCLTGRTCVFRTQKEPGGKLRFGRLVEVTDKHFKIHEHNPPHDERLDRNEYTACEPLVGMRYRAR